MNPIMNLLRKQPQSPASPSFNQIVDGLKSGRIDAKQTALENLQKLPPQQKVAIRRLLPQLKQLGKSFGVSDNDIAAFTDELQKYLK